MTNSRRYFYTSDHHFSHRKIIEYCNRPFKNVDEMNEIMVENWNKVISKRDIVFHVGDVIFEKNHDTIHALLSRLNGEKHLVFGNHDKILRPNLWWRHFQSANDIRVVHVPSESNNGVAQRIVLCHYPMLRWDQSHYGTWHLHGHCHGQLPDDPNSLRVDVGVDCWDFTPVSMEQLRGVMSKKTFVPKVPREDYQMT